ncbi:MAG: hypothetical protein AB7N73_07035 [Gemmatimonadales bacterium]
MFSAATRFTAAAAALLCLAGCGTDPTLSPVPTIGEWQLLDVAGAPLPATILDRVVPTEQGPFELKIIVVGGTLTLAEDRGYEQRMILQVLVDGQPQPEVRYFDRGTWSDGGGTLALASTFINGRVTSGSRTATRVTLQQELTGEDDTEPLGYRFGQ